MFFSLATIKMSAAHCSSQDNLSNSSEDFELAMASAAKKAKLEVTAFTQIDLEKLTLKQLGKSKNGQTMVFPLVAGEAIRTNLTPNDWFTAPFGFDLSGTYEKPSFLGGKAPETLDYPESLSLKLNLQEAQGEFLMKLDEAAQKAYAETSPAKWSPLVTGKDKYTSCKVSVVLRGAGLTKLVVVEDGAVKRGQSFEFLESFKKNFRYAEVKLVVRVKKLWCMGGKAGLSLEATQLVLKPTARPEEEDAFSNDTDLLAL